MFASQQPSREALTPWDSAVPRRTASDWFFPVIQSAPRETRETTATLCRALAARYRLDPDATPLARLALELNYIATRFGSYGNLRAKRILDLGCGATLNPDHPEATCRSFEPWLCRALVLAGASPVGVDQLQQSTEPFTSLRARLERPRSLDRLPGAFFDAIWSHGLVDSPSLTRWTHEQRTQLYQQIAVESHRLLKPESNFFVVTDIAHNDLSLFFARPRN